MGAQLRSTRRGLNPYVHFGICVGGIYVSFLVWAVCQERLSTTPYPSNSILHPTHDKFRSVTFVNTVQSFCSIISSLVFLVLTRPSNPASSSFRTTFGLPAQGAPRSRSTSHLVKLYALIALVATSAAPFGFLSLSHISFPTLLLGKSCKLVPVMLMNIVLYRRKFPLHKYLLVGLVTLGIWLFMLHKPTTTTTTKRGGRGGARETSSALGLVLLGINLVMDGVVNSTQDHVFKTFDRDPKVSGPQMMFFMNAFAFLLNALSLFVPFTLYPSFLSPTTTSLATLTTNEWQRSIEFVQTHSNVTRDVLLFGLTGAIGQLFIFATLSTYGSLTLVTITVTRKMATMVLSVVVFEHELTKGQWTGVGCVFVAVAIEAIVGIRDKKNKRKDKAVEDKGDGVKENGKADLVRGEKVKEL